MSKLRISIMAAAVVVVGALVWLQQRSRSTVSVIAVQPERGLIQQHVEERGKTRLARSHTVSMPQAGQVQPGDWDEGQPVQAGDLLAQIDPEPLDLAVQIAEADVAEQQAALDKSRDLSLETRVQKQAEQVVLAVADWVKAAQEQAALSGRIFRRMDQEATSRDERDRAESAEKQDLLTLEANRSVQAALVMLPRMVQDYIERKKLDDAITEVRRQAAQLRLQQAELDRSRAELRSPVTGVILEKHLTTPRYLSYGDPVFMVGRPDDLEIEADILSEDAVLVSPGDACEIVGPALSSLAGGRLTGTVDRVSPAGFTKVSSLGVEQQRVRVVVRLDESQKAAARSAGIGVGYQVRVRILVGQQPGALQVPRSALFRGASDQWQVFVIEDGRAQRRDVQVGLLNTEMAEVRSGLGPQDRVILEPDSRVVEGVRVRAK